MSSANLSTDSGRRRLQLASWFVCGQRVLGGGVVLNARCGMRIAQRGGEEGGEIVATGTPEDIVNIPRSITGRYLKEKLAV